MENVTLYLKTDVGPLPLVSFHVTEAVDALWDVEAVVRSEDPEIDLEAQIGAEAEFVILSALDVHTPTRRVWSGVCVDMTQTQTEEAGLSTYYVRIRPHLWLLTQRRNYRLFQHQSLVATVRQILDEWHIETDWRIDEGAYADMELKVQYGESDYHFIKRMLEEAGITLTFEDFGGTQSKLVLADAPQTGDVRALALPYQDTTSGVAASKAEFITQVALKHRMEPGRVFLRDHDYRRPALALGKQADDGPDHEKRLEQYFYTPGQFKHERNSGGETPVADDKAVARHVEEEGDRRARNRLQAHRARKRIVSYEPNVIDLWPGRIFNITRHPRADLLAVSLMAVRFEIIAEEDEHWVVRGEAVAADVPFRPLIKTDKPRLDSVQCATIVGPAGEEIYTDEYGRVRVQFPWDREGKMDDNSSCWMRVSQGWAGAGYGGIQIPRVGHEVLVAFVEGDPDQPLVVGRVYNQQSPVPYTLPENKTVSTIRSDTSPRNGGFNELRFEDAQGREHVYMQAEKDMSSLVKNDAMSVIGNNQQQLVRGNQAATVAGNRSELTKMNDTETVGLNRVSTIGMNRNATVGMTDTSFVGNMWSVTIARNLAAPLNLGLQAAYQTMSSVLQGPLGATLGQVSSTPLGMPFSGSELGPMNMLDSMKTPLLSALAGLATKSLQEDEGVPATGMAMQDKKITLTTGGATIVLDGPDVIISASGNIRMNAQKKIEIMSESDDIVIQGGPMVKINPGVKPPEARCLKGAAAEGAAFIGGSLP